MSIKFLFDVISESRPKEAIIWKDKSYSYDHLNGLIEKLRYLINSDHIKKGMVVAIKGDFSPSSIALMLVLIEKSCIIVPLTSIASKNEEKFRNIAQVEFIYQINEDDAITSNTVSQNSDNDYYKVIRKRGHAGLVLFTSGTSGEPKAAVHDFFALLEKFRTKRKSLRTLNFLLFDHWGGLNTMFHILSNSGVVIATKNRSSENICRLIDKYKIELLPASPTFLNLLLLSRAYKNYSLNSLSIISYGTEPMHESTLQRIKAIFPKVKLLQTYGLIELGVMRSKSERNDSLWVKIGGEGYKTRIIDDILQIKADSAMLGYLNAPSPFTEDGWFITGDKVLQKGEFIKILGRDSEIINVGGEKVYPAEVESVIQEMDNIAEVTVFGKSNPITGSIVCVKVRLKSDEKKKEFTSRLKRYCSKKLTKYKVPVQVEIVDEKQYGERFKKIRASL
jgi:long-chain acyl-CoA synthetase